MSQENEKTISLKSGSTLRAPNSWSISDSDGSVHLTAPESDLSLYLLEMPSSAKLETVSDLAWREVHSDFNLKHAQVLPISVTGQWEKGLQIVYELPAQEFRMVFSFLRVFHGKVYAFLVEGSNAALSRRAAEIGTLLESWKPAGFQESDLTSHPTREWDQADRKAFEDFIATTLKKLGIPGASIAIVRKDGTSVFKRAFGVKTQGQADPVTLDTPFMIGSNTKSMTTLMAAKLVEMEKVSWETPITKLLPHFKIADPDLTQKLTLRQTFSASTGMPRRDLDWLFKFHGVTPEMRLEQMAEMRPTTRPGEVFQYSNYLFMAGGYAAAKAFAPELSLEQAYYQAMKKLVFEPLQMKRTVLKPDEARALGPAMPHAFNYIGKIEPMNFSLEDACYSVAPAGAIWSTTEDLSNYLVFEMNQGMFKGTQVIAKAPLLERRKPGIKIKEKFFYGLGLVKGQEQGLDVVQHGGATLGFSSDLFFLPERELGVVILTNMRGEIAMPFIAAVRQKFLELTFGASEQSESLVQTFIESLNGIASYNRDHIHVDSFHTKDVEKWLGTYSNPNLGKGIFSKAQDGSFELDFGDWKSRVGVSFDSEKKMSLVLTEPPSSGGLKFLLSEDGNHLILDGGQDKFEFVRIGE